MIGRISLQLVIWSQVLTSVDLDRRLPLLADKLIVRGADRDPPKERPSHHGLNVSIYDDATIDLPGLLDKLVARVAPWVPAIQALRVDDPELEVILHVTFTPLHSQVITLFEPSAVSMLGAIGACINLDFLETEFVGEDDRYTPFTPAGWQTPGEQGT